MLKQYVTTLTLLFSLTGPHTFAQSSDSGEETKSEIKATQSKIRQFKLKLLQLDLIQKREGLDEIRIKPLLIKHYRDLTAGMAPENFNFKSEDLLNIKSARSTLREIDLLISLYKLDLIKRDELYKEVAYIFDEHKEATLECDTYVGQFFHDLGIASMHGLWMLAHQESQLRHEQATELFALAKIKSNGSERGKAENGSERGH